jgi:hypothetical protein
METCRDILVAYTESSYKVSPADNMRITQAKLWFKEQLKLLVSTLEVKCYSVEIEKCLLHIDNYTSLVETTESIEAAAEIHAEIISTIQAKTKGSVLEELVDQQFARKVYK